MVFKYDCKRIVLYRVKTVPYSQNRRVVISLLTVTLFCFSLPNLTNSASIDGEKTMQQAVSVIPAMVKIPGGAFVFGTNSPIKEPFMSEELPEEKVEMPPFELGATEVTMGQWDVCVAAGACAELAKGDLLDERLPARGMTKVQVHVYVDWLNKTYPGHGFRLPTEQEWEYAAKAGHDQAFWNGRGASVDEEVVAERSVAGKNKALKMPVPLRRVSYKKPNDYKLFDMLGNVFEWTAECWDSPQGARNYASTASTASSNAGCGKYCVVRGGQHRMSAEFARPTMRFLTHCSAHSTMTGFRIAK